MRTVIVLTSLLAFTGLNGQNEFAANAFYNEFRKMEEDARSGFTRYKGEKISQDRDTSQGEFRVKLLLPLADSGRIVFPGTGAPYVEYFFQPVKYPEEINRVAANLKEAIVTAYGKPLFVRSETVQPGKGLYNVSWFFTDPGEKSTAAAEFRTSIFYRDKLYFLAFRIYGKRGLTQ